MFWCGEEASVQGETMQPQSLRLPTRVQSPLPVPETSLLPLLRFWEGPYYYKTLLFHLNYFELGFSLLLSALIQRVI